MNVADGSLGIGQAYLGGNKIWQVSQSLSPSLPMPNIKGGDEATPKYLYRAQSICSACAVYQSWPNESGRDSTDEPSDHQARSSKINWLAGSALLIVLFGGRQYLLKHCGICIWTSARMEI